MSIWGVLVLALILVTIGFLGGALVVIAVGNREKQGEDPVVTSDKTNVVPVNEIDLVSLYRNPESGKLAIRFQGQSYQDKSILDDQPRLELVRIAREWLAWLGVQGEVIQQSPPSLTQESPASTLTPPPLSQAVSTKPIQKAGEVGMPTKEGTAEKAEPVTLVEQSIVSQIDDILQDRLARSTLDGRSIKLTEHPEEGVLVWVDNKNYLGVNNVPDIEVRKEIQAAVAEWERLADQRRPANQKRK